MPMITMITMLGMVARCMLVVGRGG
jgi:hypothetical protein